MSFPLLSVSHSPIETEAIGAEMARTLLSDNTLPPFIALYGDLGVGKTAFTRGLATVIAPGTAVRSPTFALVNEYRVRKTGEAPSRFSAIFHFDMYRIESEDDLDSIGFWDYLDRKGLVVIEWSERVPEALPEHYLRVTIEKCPEDVDVRRIRTELV